MHHRRTGVEAQRRTQTLEKQPQANFPIRALERGVTTSEIGYAVFENVRRRLRAFLLLFISPWLAILLWGCPIENRLIFHPSPEVNRNPSELGLQFEDVFFRTQDGVRLHGWFIPHPEAHTTLIWFHGNAGNISHRLENIKLLHDLVRVHIFIFDYRGYGRSEGSVDEQGTYADGEAAVKYILQRAGTDSRRIVLFGRSLGAAVAAETALRFDSAGLILESSFASIAEMARAIFPFVPLRWLLRSKYDVLEKVRKIKTPLLVLHGDRDEIIPFAQGKMVFDVAPEPKQFYTIVGAEHNDTYIVGGEAYFQRLRAFIQALPKTRP